MNSDLESLKTLKKDTSVFLITGKSGIKSRSGVIKLIEILNDYFRFIKRKLAFKILKTFTFIAKYFLFCTSVSSSYEITPTAQD